VRGQLDAIRLWSAGRERPWRKSASDFSPLCRSMKMFFQPGSRSRIVLTVWKWNLLGSVLIIVLVVFVRQGWRMASVAAMACDGGLDQPGASTIWPGGHSLRSRLIGMVISLGIPDRQCDCHGRKHSGCLNRGGTRQDGRAPCHRELAGPLGRMQRATLAAFTALLLAKGGTADFTRGIPV